MKQYKLYVSAFLLMCSLSVTAQDLAYVTDDEMVKKKEINKIKLSEQAVYADIIEMATDDSEALSAAHQKSRDMLQAHVIEVFAKRMKMSKADVQEIWDVIDDKCQNIVVKKGDLFRVFSYIMKDAIGLGAKKASESDVEKYLESPATQPSTAPDITAIPETAQEKPAALPIDSVELAVPQELEVSTIQPEAVREEVEVQEESPVQVQEPAIADVQPETPNAEPILTVVTTPVAPTVQSAPTPSVTEMPSRVKTMLGKSSMNDIVRYLNAEKQNNALIYGNMRTMQNPEKCYIILIEKNTQKVVGILGQGSTNRINYATGQLDSVNNYKGGEYSAIFVQEY